MKKTVLILSFLCGAIMVGAQGTKEMYRIMVDSTLLYDLSRLSDGEYSAGIPGDTILYRGERYVTNVDLFARMVKYYHFQGYDAEHFSWPHLMERSERYGAEREKSNSGSFLFECDSLNRIYIADASLGLPYRMSDQNPLPPGRDFGIREYVLITAAKAGNSRIEPTYRNILTKELYLFIAHVRRSGNGPSEIIDPLQIVAVMPLRIMPGQYDNPAVFGEYLSRQVQKEKIIETGTAVVKVAVDMRGRAKLVSCDNEALRPFLDKTIAGLPEGSLSGNYQTYVWAEPYSVRIYPILDYTIKLDGSKAAVEYVTVKPEIEIGDLQPKTI